MIQSKLQFAANLHGVLKLFVVSGVVEFQFQLFGFGVLPGQRLEVFDLLFEALDLGDGALHRDLKRFDGAFEALEEVHLHHADEEGFALPLREREGALLLILGLVRLQHVSGGIEQRQFVGGDFVVELVVGEEALAQVDLGINGDGLITLGEAAEIGDGGLVVFLNGNRSDPSPRPSPTRGEGVIAKQLLSVFPLPLWEGVRGRGVNAYDAHWSPPPGFIQPLSLPACRQAPPAGCVESAWLFPTGLPPAGETPAPHPPRRLPAGAARLAAPR